MAGDLGAASGSDPRRRGQRQPTIQRRCAAQPRNRLAARPFLGASSRLHQFQSDLKASFPFRTAHGQTLPELRHTERHLRSGNRLPLPIWKLFGQGAVGSQVKECIREEGWTLGATNLPRRDRATRWSSKPASDRGASTAASEARHHINALYRAGVIRPSERDEFLQRLR
jgi:hypothetical protein